MSESSVKCSLISALCSTDTLRANVNGILVCLPHTLRSEMPQEMSEVTERERGIQTEPTNAHVLSASQQERERVSHVFGVKMRHRLPEENAQGQRDRRGLTQAEAERWFCARTPFQTPSKMALNVSDGFASWKRFLFFSSERVCADKRSLLRPSTTDTETELRETTLLEIAKSHKLQQHVLVA